MATSHDQAMEAAYEAVVQVSKFVTTNYEKMNKNDASFQGSGIRELNPVNRALELLPALIAAIQPKG